MAIATDLIYWNYKMQQKKITFTENDQVQPKMFFATIFGMNMKRFAFSVMVMLFFLSVPKGSFTQVTRDTGEVFIEISNIISAMPGNSGNNYSAPALPELTTWGHSLSFVLDGNYEQADDSLAKIGYDVVQFLDTSGAVNTTYFMMKSNGINFWGTYVYNPNYCRALVIQSPHAKNEINTGKQGIHIFEKTQAMFFSMCGTSRCNNLAYSGCSGVTAVCSDIPENYRISDPPHNISTIFQSTTDTLFNRFPTSIFIQLHGFTKLATDPYAIVSNGTQLTPEPDYIVPLVTNLFSEDTTLTFKIAHVDLNWGRLRAFDNTQGRLINSSPDACGSNAATTNGRFIHIEQERTKLRENQAAWDKMANAVNNTFTSYPIVWEGTTSSDWNTASNWRNGSVPAATDNISVARGRNVLVINESPEAPAACMHLEIQSGATVTINAGMALTVNGDLKNSGNLTLLSIPDASASLIVYGTVSGNANVGRYIAGYSDALHGWHLLSSPVASQEISSFHTAGSGNDFLKWDEANIKWVNRTAPDGGINGDFETEFSPGTGYMIANTGNSTQIFSGVPNNSDISFSGLSFTGASTHSGWHLLGNPFPSALIWNKTAWNLSNVDATAKLWQESTASYLDIEPVTGIIPAMQGFFVHVNQSMGTLTIDASDRTHNPQNWYKNTGENELKLTVYDTEGGTSQESIIKVVEGSTVGFDDAFDSWFMAGHAPLFYSKVPEGFLSTNALPELTQETTIPLSFNKNTSSSFYIEVKGVNTLIPQKAVYLTDIKTRQTQLLNDYPVYWFAAEEDDITERFVIHFKSSNNEFAHQVNIFEARNGIEIRSSKPITGKTDIFDVSGRLIKSQLIANSINVSVDLSGFRGFAVVSVITSDEVFTKKVVVW